VGKKRKESVRPTEWDSSLREISRKETVVRKRVEALKSEGNYGTEAGAGPDEIGNIVGGGLLVRTRRMHGSL